MTRLAHFEGFDLPFHPFAFSFSSIFTKELHLAIASFEKKSSNQINIYKSCGEHFILEQEIPVMFPQTKICFSPQGTLTPIDSFISCDTKLSMYKIQDGVTSKTADISISDVNDPITSADWSKFDPYICVASCVDGTATVVDLNRNQAVSKIQTHEQPVYDISFCSTSSTFVTAGLDGSMRIFDLRDLQSFLIFYQAAMPIQRAMISPFEGYHVAALVKGSSRAVIIDNRKPGQSCALCGGSDAPITGMSWSKLSPSRLFTGHADKSICACDIGTTETISNKVFTTNGRIQSMMIGPMTLGVATDKAFEFVDATEAPNPLISYSCLDCS